jgi:signal transduction histidine kinase
VASKEIAAVSLAGASAWFTRNLHHSIRRYPKLGVTFEKPRKSSAQPLGMSPKSRWPRRKQAVLGIVKHPFKNVRWYVLLLGLAAALSILAVLQYRSTRQLSDATSNQMRATLGASLMDFRRGLENELAPIRRDLALSPEDRRQDGLPQLARGFAEWQRTAAHPALVTNVLLWRFTRRERPEVLRLDPTHGEFVPAPWPSELEPMKIELEKMSTNPGGSPNVGGERLPAPPQPPNFHHPPPWWIDQHVPALVHMDALGDSTSTPKGQPPEPIWVIVLLDQNVLVKRVFPELVERYFSGNDGLDYRITVLGGMDGQPPIYSSEAGPLRGEAKLSLFGPPTFFVLQAVVQKPGVLLARAGPLVTLAAIGPPLDSDSLGPPPGEHRDPFMLLRYSPQERDWAVLAQHRKGSLEAAVSSIFYRNLAINFGVLLVLALTTGLIIVTSARARRLAQLQVDFVAGVSHELCTPLTGIVAAAQNISDGLVDGKDQLRRYGSAILHQAHQLSDLIEQILMFSAVEKGRQRYHLQPTDVAKVVDASLKNTESLIRAAGITVERMIEPDLPRVNADFQALSRCLENLITNAIKYGGDKRWIGVRACVAASPEHKKEIRISVEDHGIGIDSADLKEIFEPFYRSPSVTAAQIHGNGLGLPLAARIAEAMGGGLRVESVPGKGSRFTVQLPVPEVRADGQSAVAVSSVNSTL